MDGDREGEGGECDRGRRASNPALEGRVVLSFTISPLESGAEGTPEGAAAGRSLIKEAALLVDDLKHPMMSACLLNSAEGLRFEAVSAPMVVNPMSPEGAQGACAQGAASSASR